MHHPPSDVVLTPYCLLPNRRCTSEGHSDLITHKRKKCVTFSASAALVNDIEPCSVLTDTERDAVWYRGAELEKFRDDARLLCQKKLKENIPVPTTTSYGDSEESTMEKKDQNQFLQRSCIPETQQKHAKRCHSVVHRECPMAEINAEDDSKCTRGLEYRSSLERQQNRYYAIRAVLEIQRRVKAQQCSMEPSVMDRYDMTEKIALIASRFTASARDVALETAINDFVEAYPEIAASVFSSAGKSTRRRQKKKKREPCLIEDENEGNRSDEGRRKRKAVCATTSSTRVKPVIA